MAGIEPAVTDYKTVVLPLHHKGKVPLRGIEPRLSDSKSETLSFML